MQRSWLLPSLLGLALLGCDRGSTEAVTDAKDGIEAEQLVENEAAEEAPAAVASESRAPAIADRTAPAPRSLSGYRLIGTEPFWGGSASAREVVYSTPENQAGERIAVTSEFDGEVEVFSGRLDGQPFILTISDGPCSDGMSDNVHAYTATLEVHDETRSGCANPRS